MKVSVSEREKEREEREREKKREGLGEEFCQLQKIIVVKIDRNGERKIMLFAGRLLIILNESIC